MIIECGLHCSSSISFTAREYDKCHSQAVIIPSYQRPYMKTWRGRQEEKHGYLIGLRKEHKEMESSGALRHLSAIMTRAWLPYDNQNKEEYVRIYPRSHWDEHFTSISPTRSYPLIMSEANEQLLNRTFSIENHRKKKWGTISSK